MYQLISCFTILLFWFQTTANTITGIVFDQTGTPAAYASIRLLRASDSTFVIGISADENGLFTFKDVKEGEYRLKVGLIGYQDVFSEKIILEKNNPIVNVNLTLQPNSNLIEVVVTAKKPLIERLIDKVVINVEGTTLSTGSNALELLQRSPGVVVTPQGSILLNGKSGVSVMLDGKPTQMNAEQLTTLLQATPAESISKIELIAKPSSKYDAEGVSGIINIRLRKNQNLGWNGNLSAETSQSIHNRKRGGLNLNYRPGKVNVFANGTISDGSQSVNQSILRYAEGKEFEQNNPMIEDFGSKSFKTGADLFLNDKNTFGVLVIGSLYNGLSSKDNSTIIRTEGMSRVDSSLRSNIRGPQDNRRFNYNVNYRFADTLGREWTVDADRIAFKNSGYNVFSNERFDGNNTRTSADAQNSDIAANIMVWSLKTDFVQSLKNGYKLETGAKGTWTNSDNNIISTTDRGNGVQPDAGRTNRFNYKENIAALYANIAHNGGKINWQLGLRTERTQVKGISTDLYKNVQNNPDTAYIGLFPTAFLQYSPKQDHQIGLAFNRRLSRPAYQDMNPFIWQIDPYTSERGNPYLRPAYSNNVELTYTYKYAASIGLSYSRTTDVSKTIARQDGQQAYTQPANLEQQDNIGININAPMPIKPWWEGYLWLGVWQNRFQSQLAEGKLDATNLDGGMYLSQQFKLGHGLQFDASMWAQFPTSDGIFTNKGIYSVNAGFKKSLLKNRATLRLVVNDVFHTQKWSQTVDFGNVRGSIYNTWESQNVAVSFSWKFGSDKVKSRDRKSGAEDADGRIKGKKE
jgi:iron complex outermembrane recepter protein